MVPNDQEMPGDQIARLVNSEESRSLAFEPELQDQEQAADLIAAIANSGGGRIVFGAEPGQPVGLANSAQATHVAGEAAKAVSPPVVVTVSQAKVEGRNVAVVEVPPGSEPTLPPKGPITRRDATGRTEAVPVADAKQALTRGGRSSDQAFDELNRRSAETAGEVKQLSKALAAAHKDIKNGQTLRAQLPGMFISGVIGAVIGVGLTVACTALLGL